MERKKNKNIILGLILALIGGVLLLKNLDLLSYPLSHYLISWKTLLIVIGIFLLSATKNLTGGVILISLGTIFWLPEIFGHHFMLHQILWPSILVVVGVVFLMQAFGLSKSKNCRQEYTKYEEIKTTESSGSEL